MSVPAPITEAVGIHGSIALGTSANSLAETCVASGTFTPSVALIDKPGTCDAGQMNFEPGMKSAEIAFRPRISPTAPLDYQVGHLVYFRFTVTGMYEITGSFVIQSMPVGFDVNGDATTNLSGRVKPGWVMTPKAVA